MGIIEQSQEIYNNAESDYQRYYFDQATGGFILIHLNHNTTLSEIFVATLLAKQGKRVKLLRENTAVKTPDAEIDGELWEFKELKNATNIRGATQKDMRQGRKQAGNIVYHINMDYNIKDINEGIKSAIRLDRQKLLRRITLIFNNGLTQTLTREEIENGSSF